MGRRAGRLESDGLQSKAGLQGRFSEQAALNAAIRNLLCRHLVRKLARLPSRQTHRTAPRPTTCSRLAPSRSISSACAASTGSAAMFSTSWTQVGSRKCSKVQG